MNESPRVTFMITTHNRVSELIKTLEACLCQSGPEFEILVVDDASSDGTFDIVSRRFPRVNIERNATNKGSIASRNSILRRARGDYIVALDDDSRLVDADDCRRIVSRMDAEPDLGIIALQIIGPEFPETLLPGGQQTGEWHCSSFACCGAVLRRSMLLQTGDFPELFVHAYEEPDLSIRAWDAGYRVLQWNDIIVYHEFSGLNRNEQRTHHRHARNEACSVVMRYPWYLVVPGVFWRLFGQARYAARRGWLAREPRVWWDFLRLLPRAIQERRSVSHHAVKMVVGMNRLRCVNAHDVLSVGALSWYQVLFGKHDSHDLTGNGSRATVSAGPGESA